MLLLLQNFNQQIGIQLIYLLINKIQTISMVIIMKKYFGMPN